MTDLTASQIVIFRRPSLPRVKLPQLNFGRTFVNLCLAYGDAFNMACSAPFSRSSNPGVSPFSEWREDGRDPRW